MEKLRRKLIPNLSPDERLDFHYFLELASLALSETHEVSLPTEELEWKRADAEKRIFEVLEAAKAGQLLRILDEDGIFELHFTPKKRGSAGAYLSRGGPEDE